VRLVFLLLSLSLQKGKKGKQKTEEGKEEKMSETNAEHPALHESLGAVATRASIARSQAWLKDTWDVIEKRVMDTAKRGLFHCTLRFEDDVPRDPENQASLIKILHSQHLEGVVRAVKKAKQDDDDPDEEVVELTVILCFLRLVSFVSSLFSSCFPLFPLFWRFLGLFSVLMAAHFLVFYVCFVRFVLSMLFSVSPLTSLPCSAVPICQNKPTGELGLALPVRMDPDLCGLLLLCFCI
jgi:hypothetical protein